MPTTYNDPVMLDSTGQDIVDKLDSIASLMGDGVIDDTSTTATDKTWSASKINNETTVLENGINANTQLVGDTVGFSRKQLIPYPYVNGRDKTQNNVTFLVKDDQTIDISIDGSASANTYFYLNNEDVYFSGSTYKICSNLDYNKISLEYHDMLQGESTWGNEVKSFGTVETVTPRSNISKQGIWIIVYSGATGNHTVKPVICDADFLDTSHEPYRDTTAFPRDEQAILGAKNLLENKLSSKTKSGITATVNADKSVTLSGTNSSSSAIGFVLSNENDALGTQYLTPFKAGGTYIFSGGGIGDPYDLRLLYKNNTYKKPTPNEPFVLEADVACVYCSVEGNATVNTTVYPMIRLASDPDDTYAPYAMTNEQLTDAVTNIEGTISSSFTLSSDGTKLVKNGKTVFCQIRIDSLTASDGDEIASLPAGFLPKKTIWFLGIDSTDGSAVPMYLVAGGGIYIKKSLTSHAIRISLTFIIE